MVDPKLCPWMQEQTYFQCKKNCRVLARLGNESIMKTYLSWMLAAIRNQWFCLHTGRKIHSNSSKRTYKKQTIIQVILAIAQVTMSLTTTYGLLFTDVRIRIKNNYHFKSFWLRIVVNLLRLLLYEGFQLGSLVAILSKHRKQMYKFEKHPM